MKTTNCDNCPPKPSPKEPDPWWLNLPNGTILEFRHDDTVYRKEHRIMAGESGQWDRHVVCFETSGSVMIRHAQGWFGITPKFPKYYRIIHCLKLES